MVDLIGPIQHKRGTTAQWAASTVALRDGELGIDTTVRRMKVGDGSTLFPGLPWQDVDQTAIARLEAAATALADGVSLTDASMSTVLSDSSSSFVHGLDAAFVGVDRAVVRESSAIIDAARRLPDNDPSRPLRNTNLVESFDGDTLDASRWFVARSVPASMRVAGGRLEIDTLTSVEYRNLYDTKNVVMTPAPQGAWQATVKITASSPDIGGIWYGIGLLSGQGQGSALMARATRPSGKYRSVFLARQDGYVRYTADDLIQADAPAPSPVWFRLVSDGRILRGYQSTNGTSFTQVGSPVAIKYLPSTNIALFALRESDSITPITVGFDLVEVWTDGVETTPVVPIETHPGDTGKQPTGGYADTLKGILQNTDKYTLGTWFPGRFGGQSTGYLDFGNNSESAIRPVADAAFALATSIAFGAYSSTVAGKTVPQAKATLIRLVQSLAYRHVANSPDGWGEPGEHAQSALWSGHTAAAAWFIWADLSDTDRALVYRMLVHEADWQMSIRPSFWKNREGVEINPGDSQSDQSAWYSLILTVACSMLPDHPNYARWYRRCVELMATAYSRPEDLRNQTPLDGRPVAAYMDGWNINSDGSVVNHNIIHPDYNATMTLKLIAMALFPLAGKAAPDASRFNAEYVYGALVNRTWTNPPKQAPGGTMYVPGSDAVYYPDGTDWGASRRMDKACLDVMVDAFGIAGALKTPAATWAGLHLNAAAAMQARSTTGQTYISTDDDIFVSKEQWVGQHAAYAWLSMWVVSTGRAFPFSTKNARAIASTDGGLAAAPMTAGQWFTVPHAGITTAQPANGLFRGPDFTVARDCLCEFAVGVTTAGSSGAVVRGAVYRDNEDGTGILIEDLGTVDATATGAKTFTSKTVLRAGVKYVLMFANQGAPSTLPVLRAMNGQRPIGDTNAATVLDNLLAGRSVTTTMTGAPSETVTFSATAVVPKPAIRAT